MNEDPKLKQRYRELPREEPPRALDDKILAASRRAVESRPAPLVAPTGRRRWYFPVAAAAVIVLAVAVVAHVDREQPDVELATSPASVPEPSPPAAAEERKAQAPKQRVRPEARQAAKPARDQFTPDPRADSAVPAAEAPAPATSWPGRRPRRRALRSHGVRKSSWSESRSCVPRDVTNRRTRRSPNSASATPTIAYPTR